MFTLHDNYGLGFLVIIKVKDLTLIFMYRIPPVTQTRVLFLAYTEYATQESDEA